jgi:hypothetical protein
MPGITENNEPLFFSVYPNPSNGLLNVKTFTTIDHLEIMNSLGQSVYSLPAAACEAPIDLNGQRKGIYIIRVVSKDGRSSSRKIILQ